MEEPKKGVPPSLLSADDIRRREASFSHPWNPDSEITGTMLARAAGLKRVGVSIARLRPGKESFIYHVHHREEEWIYVLSGRGVVEIDNREFEIGSGDFVAFPTGVAHHLRNAFEEELVYLMGGENLDFEVADFPRLGKRMVRRGSDVEVYDLRDGKPFGPLDEKEKA
jgi:uncharacterized cupin superfamily protein